MSHGGIHDHYILGPSELHMYHNWLPIQTKGWGTPFINGDTLYNGEIFNYPEEFWSDMDYLEKARLDRDTISKWDGFWSIIKDNGHEVTAFTDPLGKKQLYYKEGYGIASELRDLIEPQEPMDELYLSTVIKFGYNYDNRTPYKNIKRVIPNRIYLFDTNLNNTGISEDIVDITPKRLSKDDFLKVMDTSVKNRLKGHLEVGLLLSGGLDSSIIRHHISGKTVQSYCVDNQEDMEYAKLMDPFVRPIIIYDVGVSDPLLAMEVPINLGSMVPQYHLFKNINETVILTGDGADEVFGGYNRMKTYDSQYSDIFHELVYYHNPRIDRMAAIHTKEARSPFMHLDIVRHGLSLDYGERINKTWLREVYRGILPDKIVDRPKEPLKDYMVRKTDPTEYRNTLVEIFKKRVK